MFAYTNGEMHHRAFDWTTAPIRDERRRGYPMVDALVGIAATIYILKFIIGLFRPNPAVYKSMVAVATARAGVRVQR